MKHLTDKILIKPDIPVRQRISQPMTRRKKEHLMIKKQILPLLFAIILAINLNPITSSAATKKKITTVKLIVEVDMSALESTKSTPVDIKFPSGKFEVTSYDFMNGGFEWLETDVPRLEIMLSAVEGYSFATTDNSFSITGGTYVEQQKDNNQTLRLIIDLPPVNEFTQAIESVQWSDDHTASWSKSEGAGTYEVRLYRDGKVSGAVKRTEQTSINLVGSMTKTGTYSFRVRPVNKRNIEKKGDWVEAPLKYVDGVLADANRRTYEANNGWKKDDIGWRYEISDGSNVINDWKLINDQWYFFNKKGYMATGWINWKEKDYYCEISTGKMLINCTTPDGAVLGADGAKISY